MQECPNGLTNEEIEELLESCDISYCQNCPYLSNDNGVIICTVNQ